MSEDSFQDPGRSGRTEYHPQITPMSEDSRVGIQTQATPNQHPQITQITEDCFMGPRKDQPRVSSADYTDYAD